MRIAHEEKFKNYGGHEVAPKFLTLSDRPGRPTYIMDGDNCLACARNFGRLDRPISTAKSVGRTFTMDEDKFPACARKFVIEICLRRSGMGTKFREVRPTYFGGEIGRSNILIGKGQI